MRVIVAVFLLLAFFAHSSGATRTPVPADGIVSYVGRLREVEGGSMTYIGPRSSESSSELADDFPKCRITTNHKIRNSVNRICWQKCTEMEHRGGSCRGMVCTCFD